MTDAAITIRIRKATLEDLDEIVELWGQMMAEHARNDPRVRLAEGALPAYRTYAGYHLVHGDSCVRVAETQGGLVGFCLLTICRNLPMFLPPRYGYLSDLVVDKAWRRQHIGRRLVEESAEWLRQRNVRSVQLQYYSFNRAGEAFWQAMGFEPYYTRMWLNLFEE